jgi:hypothetical protein
LTFHWNMRRSWRMLKTNETRVAKRYTLRQEVLNR